MVNYDLPWNPNRLEQRFGRIHRIGQTEVCHLWNLCASNTREGEVYRRLLDKLEEARAALGGKVYDVLGELFEGQALRDLLVDAIRYGDRPDVKAELIRRVDGAVDVGTIETLVAERKLTCEGLDPRIVSAIREEMERAQARRLQPHFIGAFFREAFGLLGGRIVQRETGRFEITRVPGALKERDRLIGRGDRCSIAMRASPSRRRWLPANRRPSCWRLVIRCSTPSLIWCWNAFSLCLGKAGYWSTRATMAKSRACSSISNTRSATGAPAGPESRG
jgi:hypothetical protein